MKTVIFGLAMLASVSVHAEQVIQFGTDLNGARDCVDFSRAAMSKTRDIDFYKSHPTYKINDKFVSVICQLGGKENYAVIRTASEHTQHLAKQIELQMKAELQDAQRKEQLLKKAGL